MAVTIHPLAERDLSAAARIIRVVFGTFIGVPAMYQGNKGGVNYGSVDFDRHLACHWAANELLMEAFT